MVWDSQKAMTATKDIALLEAVVPRHRREKALELLHKSDYKLLNNGELNQVYCL